MLALCKAEHNSVVQARVVDSSSCTLGEASLGDTAAPYCSINQCDSTSVPHCSTVSTKNLRPQYFA